MIIQVYGEMEILTGRQKFKLGKKIVTARGTG
jgi:hypothetical protein